MSDHSLDPFAEFLLGRVAPAARAWFDASAYLARQRTALRAALEERAPGTPRIDRFAAKCPFEGAAPADYALRRHRLASGCEALVAIHFYGLDASKPFVDVEAQDRVLSPEEITEAVEELAALFRVFRPPVVRFRSPRDGASIDDLPGARPDMAVFAGPLGAVIDAPPPPGLERVSLRDDEPAAYFDEYAADYAQLLDERPFLKGRLNAETLETLHGFRASGCCLRLLIDGQPAGVVASEPGSFAGIEGWIVGEELIAKPWRGQRLGGCAQRRLAEAIVERVGASRSELLIGTIDALNEASRRTARSLGRIDAAGWTFFATEWATAGSWR